MPKFVKNLMASNKLCDGITYQRHPVNPRSPASIFSTKIDADLRGPKLIGTVLHEMIHGYITDLHIVIQWQSERVCVWNFLLGYLSKVFSQSIESTD